MRDIDLHAIATRIAISGSSRPKIPSYTFRGMNDQLPSRDSGIGVAAAKPQQHYTGTAILGVATMHKSNAIPIFTEEHAKEVSAMRR